MKELIAYVKANKDKVTYANAGVGSASHLCGMLFMTAIQTELTTVPYKGTGPAMNDLLGGQVDFMCDQTTNTTGQIKAGKVKVYAVTTPKRVPSLPDVPTMQESGLPDFDVAVWHGLYAPKGTPKPVIDKLSAALQTALKDPNVKTRFAELGTEPVSVEQATPDALRKQAEVADRPLDADHQEGGRLRGLTRSRTLAPHWRRRTLDGGLARLTLCASLRGVAGGAWAVRRTVELPPAQSARVGLPAQRDAGLTRARMKRDVDADAGRRGERVAAKHKRQRAPLPRRHRRHPAGSI